MGTVRIAVVGPCASGKSSVVAGLRQQGCEAYGVAQEHSIVRDLWRHQTPDKLVFLDVSLAVLRERRDDAGWPAWIYEAQCQRLHNAREHADLVVDTEAFSVAEIVAMVLEKLA